MNQSFAFRKNLWQIIYVALIIFLTEACLLNPIVRSLLNPDINENNNNFLSLLLLRAGATSTSAATSPPENISYGNTRTFRLVPDVNVSLSATVTGVVD
jgi:hypothetical protein